MLLPKTSSTQLHSENKALTTMLKRLKVAVKVRKDVADNANKKCPTA